MTRDRTNEHPACVDSRPINAKLTTIEESVLVQWNLSIDYRGLVSRAPAVHQIANLLLVKRLSHDEEKPIVEK